MSAQQLLTCMVTLWLKLAYLPAKIKPLAPKITTLTSPPENASKLVHKFHRYLHATTHVHVFLSVHPTLMQTTRHEDASLIVRWLQKKLMLTTQQIDAFQLAPHNPIILPPIEPTVVSFCVPRLFLRCTLITRQENASKTVLEETLILMQMTPQGSVSGNALVIRTWKTQQWHVNRFA